MPKLIKDTPGYLDKATEAAALTPVEPIPLPVAALTNAMELPDSEIFDEICHYLRIGGSPDPANIFKHFKADHYTYPAIVMAGSEPQYASRREALDACKRDVEQVYLYLMGERKRLSGESGLAEVEMIAYRYHALAAITLGKIQRSENDSRALPALVAEYRSILQDLLALRGQPIMKGTPDGGTQVNVGVALNGPAEAYREWNPRDDLRLVVEAANENNQNPRQNN